MSSPDRRPIRASSTSLAFLAVIISVVPLCLSSPEPSSSSLWRSHFGLDPMTYLKRDTAYNLWRKGKRQSEEVVAKRAMPSSSDIDVDAEEYEYGDDEGGEQLEPLLGKILAEMGRRRYNDDSGEFSKRTAAYSQWRKNGRKRSSFEVDNNGDKREYRDWRKGKRVGFKQWKKLVAG